MRNDLACYGNSFYFDFSAQYVGVGMIYPYLINISVLVGSVQSWGIMYVASHKKQKGGLVLSRI